MKYFADDFKKVKDNNLFGKGKKNRNKFLTNFERQKFIIFEISKFIFS